jgi:hypothetical protein
VVRSGLESRAYGRRDASRWQRGNLYPQKLALTSPTSGGRSVGIVRSRTQATEFSFFSGPYLYLDPEPSVVTGFIVVLKSIQILGGGGDF